MKRWLKGLGYDVDRPVVYRDSEVMVRDMMEALQSRHPEKYREQVLRAFPVHYVVDPTIISKPADKPSIEDLRGDLLRQIRKERGRLDAGVQDGESGPSFTL